jgi:hypothetical protein
MVRDDAVIVPLRAYFLTPFPVHVYVYGLVPPVTSQEKVHDPPLLTVVSVGCFEIASTLAATDTLTPRTKTHKRAANSPKFVTLK